MEAQTEQISKDMVIGDIVMKYPQVASVISRYGLHCVGCHVSTHETLEEGALGHGLTDEDVDNMVKDMNTVLSKTEVKKATGEKSVEVTEAAVTKFKEIMKKEGKEGFSLRMSVISGGCSGYSYEMTFVEEKQEGDLELEQHGLKVYVDGESLDFISGAIIDHVENLQEQGFKINNPNAQSNCGCGKSFA